MQTIKPASNQVFAKPHDEINKTSSGIFIPSGKGEKPQTAEVINVGSDVKECKQKDTIIYKRFTTTEFKLNDEQYILLEDQDVLGLVLDATKE